MLVTSKGRFLLSCALLGALAPLIIGGFSHFVPDPYKNYCGEKVATSYCAENILAERSASRFDLGTLPFWPTRPIIAVVGFIMMEEGRDGDWTVQISVTTLAMALNAASYALVGLVLWKLKDSWKLSRKPMV